MGIIFKQTFWQIIGKVISSVSTFIILGIVARNYHEAGVGKFSLVLTYLAMFNLLSDFGFNAHELRDNRLVWPKLLGVRIIWSVILSIVALAILLFFSKELVEPTFFGILAILGSAIFVTCNLIFQKKQRYDLSILASSIGTIAGLIAYIWLATIKLPVSFLLYANSLSWIVIAFFSLILVKKFLPSFSPIFDKRYSINLFKECWPIAATLGLNVVYFRADAFILAYFKGFSQAGVYNLAYSIFQAALVLPTFVMNAYYPILLKGAQKIKTVALLLIAVALVGTLLTLIFSSQIISALTGKGFGGSAQALQILSLSFPAFFLSSLLMWVLISKGQYKKMLVIYAIGLIFNLAANFFYIPLFSYSAASVVTVISEYLILLLLTVSL